MRQATGYRRARFVRSDAGRRAHRLGWAALAWLAIALAALAAGATPAVAQSNEDCLMCHEDPDATGGRDGRSISVHVDPEAFAVSAHGEVDCIACHQDLDGTDFPHVENPEPVDCSFCHEDMADDWGAGAHGKASAKGDKSAPRCADCHDAHAVPVPGERGEVAERKDAQKLCGTCHTRQAGELGRSAHGKALAKDDLNAPSCIQCHGPHRVLPHTDPTSPTATKNLPDLCGKCHADVARLQARSLHGQAALHGDEMAPTCVDCHGEHEILSHLNPKAPTATMNVPLLCGQCHREGSPVSRTHQIPQDRILENYSQSIHGQGLYEKGLSVTAVCTSCHTSHDILPHADPRSSIFRDNVAHTCEACHARIEQVHRKVIEGRLWEEEPGKIPACVDCHAPHKIRKVFYPSGMANQDCMTCHGKPGITMERDGETVSLFVDAEAYGLGAHAGTACAQCHTEVAPSHDRPCETIVSKVDCSICHAEQVDAYQTSIHGQLRAENDPDAPVCLDCHSPHQTLKKTNPASPTFARNVPALCAQCHRAAEKAAVRIHADVPDIVQSYNDSIHGRGLLKSGLVVTATCTSCHSSHHELPPSDPSSTVNPANVADTCGTCHHGIEETFRTSIHFTGEATEEHGLPTCEDCHTSHTITRADIPGFRTRMMGQCGRCHEVEAETFFDTFHGKVSRLGSEGAAKCYDCHGTHDILPPENPDSSLSRRNVVDTCGKCHERSHRRFAGYLTHATHHDQHKYPWLFYAFWFMTALLVGTLTFALIHTFAWLIRLWLTRDEWKKHKALGHRNGKKLYRRFTRLQRTMHVFMILSFFTLALTGMSLKFSYTPWAQLVSRLLGGFESMGLLHRMGAIVLFGIFSVHFYDLIRQKRASGRSWLGMIFGRDSMMFNLTDLKQAGQSIRWFFGLGPRPRFGRYTYWEKFDYFAVFWGIFIIGSTGLLLWFPETFTYLVPGWFVNVATIIHSDEALLAVGFIFTIHFFNTHFRPDKFPLDSVIFTGRVTLDELKYDKPAEYEQLVASGKLDEYLVDPIPSAAERGFRIFGFIALCFGLTLIALIIYAMLFGYR